MPVEAKVKEKEVLDELESIAARIKGVCDELGSDTIEHTPAMDEAISGFSSDACQLYFLYFEGHEAGNPIIIDETDL